MDTLIMTRQKMQVTGQEMKVTRRVLQGVVEFLMLSSSTCSFFSI
jgi:hypothetical protein